MKSLLAHLLRPVKSFHKNDDGMEPLQVVMLLAIAALVIIAIFAVGDEIFQWWKDTFQLMEQHGGVGF